MCKLVGRQSYTNSYIDYEPNIMLYLMYLSTVYVYLYTYIEIICNIYVPMFIRTHVSDSA